MTNEYGEHGDRVPAASGTDTETAGEAAALIFYDTQGSDGQRLLLHLPRGTPPADLPALVAARQRDIAQHGPVLAAYLALPDTDATRTDLVEHHRTHFVSDFADMDDLINTLTEALDWQHDLDSFAEARGISGMVRLDRRALARRLTDTWDIVQTRGRLYVFER